MSREFCYYCGEPQGEKIGCCGENHFNQMYGFKCEDLSKEYPYGAEWSFNSDGSDIIDVQWFKTEDERDIFTEEEGFNMIREDFTTTEPQGIVYDPPMSETEQYLLDKEREEEYKSYDY